MGLDFSAAALIGCGAGLIFCVFGAFFVAHAKGNRSNLALGIAYIANGLAGMVLYIGGFQLPSDQFTFAVPVYSIALALDSVSLTAMVVFVVQHARRLPAASRRIVAWSASGLGLCLAGAIVILALEGFPPLDGFTGTRLALSYFDGTVFAVFLTASAVLAVAGLESIRRGLDWSRTGAALLFAAFPMLRNASSGLSVAVIELAGHTDDLLAYAALLASLMIIVPLAWSLRAMAAPYGKHPRNFLLLVTANMILMAFVYLAFADTPVADRIDSILLMTSMAAPAYAVLRLDLLQTRLRRLTFRAGTIASVGLAALFITAQVAQNFFSAKYGLYIGGVVAGVAVFAAYPLQKAAERAMEKRGEIRSDATGPADKYRRLVETAWRDGRLGANERLMLSESIDLLGLDNDTARRIDDEVARKHVVPRRSGSKSARPPGAGPDEGP